VSRRRQVAFRELGLNQQFSTEEIANESNTYCKIEQMKLSTGKVNARNVLTRTRHYFPGYTIVWITQRESL